MSDDSPDDRLLDAGLEEELVLAEIVSHVLDRGAVIAGQITISVAGIDLVELGLNLYLSSTETASKAGLTPFAGRHPAALRRDAAGSPPAARTPPGSTDES